MAEQTLHPPSAGDNRGETQDSEGQSTQRSSVTEKRSLCRIFPLFARAPGIFLREDLADALSSATSEDGAAFSPEEKAMLHNILRLREIRVEDVMIPRADVEAVEITTPLWEVLELLKNPAIPVCRSMPRRWMIRAA